MMGFLYTINKKYHLQIFSCKVLSTHSKFYLLGLDKSLRVRDYF